jgi:glucokinase
METTHHDWSKAGHFAIGMDIGGSSAKMGLVDRAGQLIIRHWIPTPIGDDPTTVAEAYADGVRELLSRCQQIQTKPAGLGVGIPGHISPDRRSSPFNNVHALDNFPLADYLGDHLGLSVELDNDGTLAALAEHRFGAGKGSQHLLVTTVGTGIGAGLVVKGELQRPTRGCLGDPGHLIVAPDSPLRCGSGCQGCLETVASSLAIEREAGAVATENPRSRLARKITGQGVVPAAEVIEAARAGEPDACCILERAGRWLGVGLASWCCLYEPDLILIGGGVSAAGELLLAPARREMARLGMPAYVDEVPVALASLGNDAGLIGAACLFLTI